MVRHVNVSILVIVLCFLVVINAKYIRKSTTSNIDDFEVEASKPNKPTRKPTSKPTKKPTKKNLNPIAIPTPIPTANPTAIPTDLPSPPKECGTGPFSNWVATHVVTWSSEVARLYVPCCAAHDDCYDTCGARKEDCDKWFLQCLKGVCPDCWSPQLYYSAVAVFGGGPWDRAQAKCAPTPQPSVVPTALPTAINCGSLLRIVYDYPSSPLNYGIFVYILPSYPNVFCCFNYDSPYGFCDRKYDLLGSNGPVGCFDVVSEWENGNLVSTMATCRGQETILNEDSFGRSVGCECHV